MLSNSANEIRFTKVDLPYGWLGNMHRSEVSYRGKRFKSTEVLFHWLRFENHQEIQNMILAQKSSMAAKMKVKKIRRSFSDEEWVKLTKKDMQNMRMCLRLKVEQHSSLKKELMATGSKEIIEDCTSRDRGTARYWGAVLVNGIWEGENRLGQLWMELRNELKNDSEIKLEEFF